MGHMSPPPQAGLGTSPNQFNHFAPLSPDLLNSALDADPEMNAILGLAPPPTAGDDDDTDPAIASFSATPRRPPGPLITYTRAELLRLSRRGIVPEGMGPLESWFGTLPPKAQHVDDPAIAAIGPGGGGGRRAGGGGFGEGFGFGGGIGGRGLGRGGTRNIGLRRQPDAQADPAIAETRPNFGGGPMGKFAVRAPGERGMRLGGDEQGMRRDGNRDRERRRDEGDWRRGERAVPMRNGDGGSRRQGYNRYEDDGAEPAWMNDGPETGGLEDPAIAGSSAVGDPSSSDGLIKYVPGEDPIAAHKRAMKARAAGGGAADNWRQPSDKPLVSFFGGAPAAEPAPTPPKPREVNVASYFKQRVVEEEEPKQEEEPEPEPSNAFQSRFQRFFGSTGAPQPAQSQAPLQVPQPPQQQQQQQQPVVRSPAPPDLSSQHVQQQHVQQRAQQPSPGIPTGPSPAPRVDDHMAKLMGLLSTKNASPAPRPDSAELGRQQAFQAAAYAGPPPGLSPHYTQSPPDAPGSDYINSGMHTRHDQSPDGRPPMMPPHFTSPPPGADPRQFQYGPGGPGGPPGFQRPPMPSGDLGPGPGPLPGGPSPRPYYDPSRGPLPGPGPDRQMPPDLLQLLNQNGGRPPMPPGPMPPPMGMLPPHPMQQQGMYARGGPSPDDLLRSLQAAGPGGHGGPSPGPGPGGPPGYLSMGPPGPRGPPPGPSPTGPYPPPPNMQGFLPPQPPYGYQQPPRPMPPGMFNNNGASPYPPNQQQQQDILAALLGPRQ